jgi:hypothetical protein
MEHPNQPSPRSDTASERRIGSGDHAVVAVLRALRSRLRRVLLVERLAQAIAFGGGGFLGTVAVDCTRWLIGSPVTAYGMVFVAEAALFLLSVGLVPARVPQAGDGLQSAPGSRSPVVSAT